VFLFVPFDSFLYSVDLFLLQWPPAPVYRPADLFSAFDLGRIIVGSYFSRIRMVAGGSLQTWHWPR
jgi:hypothetical protein